MTTPTSPTPVALNISTAEFIVLAALLICLTALSIDIMLPVLPELAQDLGVTNANDRQWVVTSYLGGLVVGQLFVGVASDRFGRLPVLFAGLMLFVIGALIAAMSGSFTWLLIARALQGIGGAAPRIIVVAIVRDLFAGRAMARIMSFVMSVFIMVPVFAPAVGQAVASFGGWRATIYVLVAIGSVAIVWAWMRLPETAPARQSGATQTEHVGVLSAFAAVISSRRSVGYIAANGFMFACLMGYILSSQQIFVDVYELGANFPLAFGAIAAAMAAGGLINARIVMNYGMRHVSHRALAAFFVIALMNGAISLSYEGQPPFWLFWCGLWLSFFCFSLIVSNFNALAMEPLGRVAGAASSAMGAYTTLAGAGFGTLAGQLFDMTTLPLTLSFVIYATLALITVIATEGWRRFGQEPEIEHSGNA